MPRRSSPQRTSSQRRWWIFAGLLVLLIGFEGTYRRIRSSIHPVSGAEWIWQAGEPPREARPVSFFAVRDFRLDAVPAQARLLILADEEYRATLNGRFLGGNRYGPGMPLDDFDVTEVLVAGGNRLVVQLRSERGGGGLLASLQEVSAEGDTRTLVETDTSWGIASRLGLGEIRGWQPLSKLETPRSWGRAPVGRWGMPRIGPPRRLPEVLGAPRSLTAEIPASSQPAELRLDWGRSVTGYLALELPPGSPRLGKVVLGESSAGTSPAGELPMEEAVAVIVAERELRWQDALPRRFRYARVLGWTDLVGAYVDLADEAEIPPTAGGSASSFETLAPPLASPSDLATREASETP